MSFYCGVDMAKEWAKQFYNSKAWKECRKSFIQERVSIDGGLCQTCHKEPGYIVHHNGIWLTPSNITDPVVALNHDNLKYDCLICHNAEKEQAEKPRYYFDVDGNMVLIPDDD
jgi:hypothetical protein